MRLLLTLAGFCVTAPLLAQNPFTDDARQTYALIKTSLLAAAEKMPAEHYAFRTVPEVRNFAEMIAHTIDGQTLMCAVVKGETAPGARVSPGSATKAKADLIPALKASFAYCDPIYATITDTAAVTKVRWARWDMTKLGLLNWNISHNNEMYGIIAAFLRMKGIVPPSSEGRP